MGVYPQRLTQVASRMRGAPEQDFARRSMQGMASGDGVF